MGCFVPEALLRLRSEPLEQLWRDHLLAGSLMLDQGSGFRRGTFTVVYPSENAVVANAIDDYRVSLTSATTFDAWTLETVLDAIEGAGAGTWPQEVRERYLG